MIDLFSLLYESNHVKHFALKFFVIICSKRATYLTSIYNDFGALSDLGQYLKVVVYVLVALAL